MLIRFRGYRSIAVDNECILIHTQPPAAPSFFFLIPSTYYFSRRLRPIKWIGGKLDEDWDANTGLRASCPNFRPKNSWAKVRTNFQSQTYFWQYSIFHDVRCNFYFHQLHGSFGFGCGISQVVYCFVRLFGQKSDHWSWFVRLFTQFTNRHTIFTNW